MAVEDRVRVFVEPDDEQQHLSVPPGSDTSRSWEGETLCGAAGTLRWVSPENVDVGRLCADCAAVQGGFAPPLQGESMGPP